MSDPIRLLVGSDSAGFDYKDRILADMQADDRVEVIDLGVFKEDLEGSSYPSVPIAAGKKTRAGEAGPAAPGLRHRYRGRDCRQQGARHPRDGCPRLVQCRAVNTVQ